MIHQVDVHEAGDYPITVEAKGRGGTMFAPVFDWIAEQEFTPACVVYFTDLDCSHFGDEPACPVLWATVAGGEAPFGEVINVTD
jgi:predicted metal-dependent peptidase